MGVFATIGNHLKNRLSLKTIASEMASTITDRIIPHGAAELAHGIITQSTAYVPYGQETVPVADADAVQDTPPSLAEQYQASLAMNAQAAQPESPDHVQAPGI